MEKERINKLKSRKLFLVVLAFLIAKKEIGNYNDKLNAEPKINTKQNEKQILPTDGFNLKHDNYLSIRKYECKKSVIKYCKIYGIKESVVMNIIDEYSESFTSPEFQNNKDIFCSGEIYDNFDSQILLLVHDIYSYPGQFGYSYDEVIYDGDNQNVCDMTIREYLYETSNILGLDKDTALAIACAESYYFEASIATSSNNPFALNSSNGFRKFDNIYLGISEGLINLKRGYPALNISSMASTYCPPNPEHWISLVNGVKNELINGRMLYDEINKELALK